jgi:hypothetical protein
MIQTQLILSLLIIVAIGLVTSVKVGAWWLRLALIDVLAVMLVKRLDNLGGLVGHDIITSAMSDLATLLALFAIIFAFVAAYQRRVYLAKAEAQRRLDLLSRHQGTIQRLEEMRATAERQSGTSWDLERRLI